MATRTMPKVSERSVRVSQPETDGGEMMHRNHSLDFVNWLSKRVVLEVAPKNGLSKRTQIAVETINLCIDYLEKDASKKVRMETLSIVATHTIQAMTRENLRKRYNVSSGYRLSKLLSIK